MIPAVTAVGPVGPTDDGQNHPGPFRVGELIAAKVETTDRNGITRLLVAGMTVHVASPTKLPAGSIINLLVKQNSASGLILELKRSESVAHSMELAKAHGPITRVGARGTGLLSALLDIGAALAAAKPGLTAEQTFHATSTTSPDRGASPPPDGDHETGTPTAQHLHSGIVPDARQNDTVRPHAHTSQPEANEPRTGSEARPDAKLPRGGTPDQSTAPQSMIINYALPGAMEHLQIAVTHHDDDNGQRHFGRPEKSIEARFSIDQEALGRVHVVMRQHGSAISISLWAERPEVAAQLLRERAELRNELGAAHVEVAALEFHTGQPSIAVPGIVTSANGAVA